MGVESLRWQRERRAQGKGSDILGHAGELDAVTLATHAGSPAKRDNLIGGLYPARANVTYRLDIKGQIIPLSERDGAGPIVTGPACPVDLTGIDKA